MEFTRDTRLQDILNAYPWLPEEAARMDPRLRAVNTPFGRLLIRRSTLADAERLSGYPVEKIIEELKKMIAAHAAE